LLAFGLDKDGGHAMQLLLSGDGSKPAAHWQAKAVGSALLDTFTALATQAQRLDPAAVALLKLGQWRQVPELLIEGLKVEGEQAMHFEPSKKYP
jgi:hypothetical protein